MHLRFVITLLFLVVNCVSAQNSRHVQFEIRVQKEMGIQVIKLRKEFEEELNKLKMEIVGLMKILPINCDDLYKMGKVNSGVEKIYPYKYSLVSNFVQAYCEYIVEGEYQGGWTVIQRRDDDVTRREPFNRTWEEYKTGFGNTEEEYWIGLKTIHALTTRHPMQLQIILEDWENRREVVHYKNFRIDDESKNFLLHISGFNGNIYDSMDYHNEYYFSTMDKDNDGSSGDDCANEYGGGGGWWFDDCDNANLNGVPHPAGKKERGGIHWFGFPNTSSGFHPLRRVVMMVKPRD